jgi:hypothetical protein
MIAIPARSRWRVAVSALASCCIKLICITAASPALAEVPVPTVYLGVLEAPLERAGRSSAFHMRIAFRFEDRRWRAMPRSANDEGELTKLATMFPARMSWTIVLHGKRLGEVSSVRASGHARYSDIGLEDLTGDSSPPRVREGAAAFATWLGSAPYRPLLAISEPNYHDPDRWTPYDPPPTLLQRARAAFKHTIALDMHCNGKCTRSYPDSVIEIYGKPFRSKGGDILIAMRPEPRRNKCEGPAGDEWQSVWFHLKGNDFQWIGDSLTLLEIGDFSGDGTSQIVFQYDGYDRDGYVLVDPRDNSKTEFMWSYQ